MRTHRRLPPKLPAQKEEETLAWANKVNNGVRALTPNGQRLSFCGASFFSSSLTFAGIAASPLQAMMQNRRGVVVNDF